MYEVMKRWSCSYLYSLTSHTHFLFPPFTEVGVACETTGSSHPVLTTFSGVAWNEWVSRVKNCQYSLVHHDNDTNTMGSSLHCLSHWLHLLHLLGL